MSDPLGIIVAMTPGIVLTPLDVAVAPARAKYHTLLSQLAEWGLARGRPIDADVAAYVLAVADLIIEDGGPLGRWTRPRVNDLLFAGLTNWCAFHGCLRPEGECETLWQLLHFLDDTGRLHEQSDALCYLLEPLRCYGGLNASGVRPLVPELPDFPCQCFLDVLPPSRPGLSRTTTNEDLIIELWRPARCEPPLVSWYRSLAKFSRTVRREQIPWLVHMEDFEVVGRIEAQGRSVAVWMYRHLETHGELFLDDDGQPYLLRPDSRRRVGFRLVPTEARTAVWRADLPTYAARSDSRPPDDDWYGDPCDVSDGDGPILLSEARRARR